MADQFLVVGLGNPGREYRHNRHNVGFICLDRLAGAHGTRFSKKQNDSLVASIRIDESNVLLAKPQTYMNLSGRAVRGLMNFYKLPVDHLLVVLDELDLPLGRIRIRAEGGSAGHKGLASIIENLGTPALPRLRIGIGHPRGRMDTAAHVLQDFQPDELEMMNAVLDGAVAAIECFLREGVDEAMNRFNAPGETQPG